MQQIYMRTPMRKCDQLCSFTETALWHGCFPVNLQQVFRTPFPQNTFGGLLFYIRTFPKPFSFTFCTVNIFSRENEGLHSKYIKVQSVKMNDIKMVTALALIILDHTPQQINCYINLGQAEIIISYYSICSKTIQPLEWCKFENIFSITCSYHGFIVKTFLCCRISFAIPNLFL